MKTQYIAFEIAIKMKKLMNKIEKVQSILECEDMSFAQERIIFPIFRDEKGYSIQELSHEGGIAKSLVSRTVADLEKRGFVMRDKKSINQDRNYKIILTEKGKKFVENKNERVLEVTDKWFGNFSKEFLFSFNGMLDTLIDTENTN
ncbi:MAG: MarR family transcriptional regulator [Firmicutes bacterium]|nr:MarR family transcriptional regulator [Bacillota bacterium]